MACLQAWEWPGNVRELENVIERVVNLCEGLQITRADLPESVQASQTTDGHTDENLSPSLQDMERACIMQVIDKHNGNLRQSAL